MSSVAPAATRAATPGLRSWLLLIRCEATMTIRDTSGLLVPLLLPLLILVMSAAPAAAETTADGLSGLEVFVLPLVFATVMAFIGVLNMPSFLAYYRRSGVLRRLSVTPASPAMVLVAQVVVSFLQATLGVGLAWLVAATAFGAQLPSDLVLVLGLMVLSLGAMYGVGMIVAALAPTPNAAVAIGLVLFFAVAATGGMFGGTDVLPQVVAEVGLWLPYGASIEAVSSAWSGDGLEARAALTLLGWLGLGALVGAAFFRWE